MEVKDLFDKNITSKQNIDDMATNVTVTMIDNGRNVFH